MNPYGPDAFEQTQAQSDEMRKFLREHSDKDGLIPCEHLVRPESGAGGAILRLRSKASILVYPTAYALPLIDYLANSDARWDSSKIRLNESRKSERRARLRGPNFEKAVNDALRERKSFTSIFMLDSALEEGDLSPRLVVSLSCSRKEDQVNLQMHWPIIGQPEVKFLHAIGSRKSGTFVHCDGAIKLLEAEELKSLYDDGKQPRTRTYRKHFRVDGSLTDTEVTKLACLFSGFDDLVKEFHIKLVAGV